MNCTSLIVGELEADAAVGARRHFVTVEFLAARAIVVGVADETLES